jgi:alpha-amylase
MNKVASKSYLPANRIFLELLEKHPEFKISYSFSGIFLEQIERDFPEILESFRKLIKTGQVEVLSETYYHSLAFLFSQKEFEHQVEMHRQKVRDLFGIEPSRVFRNTELTFSNDLAKAVEAMGYEAVLAEGADRVLGWRNPNFVYQSQAARKTKLLLKNYRLSDDIAFRFSEQGWTEHPLSADTFSNWVSANNGNGHLINLFMDYETFGEHQWEETGIFEFLRHLPEFILKHPDNDFVTPSEAIRRYPVMDELDVPDLVSWADTERDLSAWLGNSLQNDAINKLYALEEIVAKTEDKKLAESWRRLQTSDHFYYMCTKWFNDGDVHKYFNPYESPYEAFISFMNVLNDLKLRLESHPKIREADIKAPALVSDIQLPRSQDYVINLNDSLPEYIINLRQEE